MALGLSLTSTVEDERKRADDAEAALAERTNERDAALASVAALRKEAGNLRGDIATAQSSVSHLQEANAGLNARVEKADRELAALKTSSAAMERTLNDRLDVLKREHAAERDRMLGELSKALAASDQWKAAHEEEAASNDQHRAEIARLHDANAELARAAGQAQKEKIDLESNVRRMAREHGAALDAAHAAHDATKRAWHADVAGHKAAAR